MSRKKNPVTEKMKVFSDELNNLHNSNEFHELFNILCEYEADGGSSEDECGRLIQKHIEKLFFKELRDPKAKKEIEFILISLGKMIRSVDYGFESRQQRDDLIFISVEKIIRNANYDITAPAGKKYAFIKTILKSCYMDFCRTRGKERDAINSFFHEEDSEDKEAS